MKVNAAHLWAVIVSIITLIFSLIFLPFYWDGDQYFYRDFYRNCFHEGYNHARQLFCYQNTLGSTEPVYFYLAKFANPYFEKDYFIAIANTIFSYLMVLLIFKWYKKTPSRLVFLGLVCTNYYFIVLMLAAERLKFSFIFLIAALVVSKNWQRFALFGLSLMTHIQSALLIATFLIANVLKDGTKLWIKAVLCVVGVVGFAGAFIVLQDHILSKFVSYSEGTEESGLGIISVIKTSIFVVLAFISTRKILPVVAGTPLVLLSYFLGSERIGMLTFILYVCSVIYYKRKADLLLLLVMLYFTAKTPGYISNVITYGMGYLGTK